MLNTTTNHLESQRITDDVSSFVSYPSSDPLIEFLTNANKTIFDYAHSKHKFENNIELSTREYQSITNIRDDSPQKVYLGITLSELINDPLKNIPERKITVELVKKYSLIQFVGKIYIRENLKEGFYNIDIVLTIASYSNEQLKQLLQKELEIRELFNQISIVFNYITSSEELISSDSIQIYQKE